MYECFRTFVYEAIRITIMTNNVKPSDGELEILNILWNKGPCTVRDVHEVLEASKGSGYTTTLKLMQIMLDKGLVKRDGRWWSVEGKAVIESKSVRP